MRRGGEMRKSPSIRPKVSSDMASRVQAPDPLFLLVREMRKNGSALPRPTGGWRVADLVKSPSISLFSGRIGSGSRGSSCPFLAAMVGGVVEFVADPGGFEAVPHL